MGEYFAVYENHNEEGTKLAPAALKKYFPSNFSLRENQVYLHRRDRVELSCLFEKETKIAARKIHDARGVCNKQQLKQSNEEEQLV